MSNSAKGGAKTQSGAAKAQRWGSEVPQRDAQFAAKRMAILRAAAQMFAGLGYHETSLNELARRLGVSKPALYYYVKSKDDILLQCLDVAMQDIRAALADAEACRKDARQKLKLFVARYVDLLTGDFGKCLVLAGITPLAEEQRQRLAVGYREIDRAIQKIVAAGLRDGSLARCDTRMVTFALFGALHWITKWYQADGGKTPAQIAAGLFQVFELGLKPRA